MPSPTHEALVMLFKNRPGIALELLRDAFAFDVPAEARVSVVSETVRQVRPVEIFADVVLRIEQDDRAVLAIIVEVQLTPPRTKSFSWPVYLSIVRRDLECPSVLLVVAFDDAVARACERPIELGHPGFVLRPLVLGRGATPRIVEQERAMEDVELAVLSAVAHGGNDATLEVVLPALYAIRGGPLDDDRRRVYHDLVLSGLGAAARAALEELMMKGYEYQSDFAKKYVAQGREEGRSAGEANALLLFLAARGFAVDEALRERVVACRDLDRLDRWIQRAAVAATLDEVFAET